jgi:hypothetical protein
MGFIGEADKFRSRCTAPSPRPETKSLWIASHGALGESGLAPAPSEAVSRWSDCAQLGDGKFAGST